MIRMEKAQELLRAFEDFLASIPLDRYREELLPVKTVEQDLPKSLNPLPSIYEAYWTDELKPFPDYDQFFRNWWQSHLLPLDEFISRYFWGCSRDFVYLGFKARIYRTIISVLTQFHFAYLWKSVCELPLEASAELDMDGIDALVTCGHHRIALQVKKETYRAEARGRGRFAQRKWKVALVVEVPYTVTRPEGWEATMGKARKDETKEQAQLFLFVAEKLQRWLPNGFAVFQPDYPRLVECLIRKSVEQGRQGIISWQETLERLRTWSCDHPEDL